MKKYSSRSIGNGAMAVSADGRLLAVGGWDGKWVEGINRLTVGYGCIQLLRSSRWVPLRIIVKVCRLSHLVLRIEKTRAYWSWGKIAILKKSRDQKPLGWPVEAKIDASLCGTLRLVA